MGATTYKSQHYDQLSCNENKIQVTFINAPKLKAYSSHHNDQRLYFLWIHQEKEVY
jgi:hypothetical protein